MAFTYENLANLIFPDITETIEDLEKKYPPRKLDKDAKVTRFAPSPTGFLHTGSLFTALIAKTFAKQSNGVYIFRLEDTDQKREIKGSGDELCKQLAYFGVTQDEGYMGDSKEEIGIYGPYVQSKRAYIYKVCIKELIKKGKAYPCFCTKEDLDKLRLVQERTKEIPGYYGEYATCRHLKLADYKKKIEAGEPFVIRFRSNGNHNNFIKVHDLVRGDLNLSENDQDIVIYKSDGLPTYHMAHAVDDHFMRVTTVTRGEEWLPSLPIHLELFNALGFQAPEYAHLPVINVLDKETNHKRKLSKRKDKEAAVEFFIQEGYPILGIIKYLYTIANSNFEEWLLQNQTESLDKFTMTFNKMSLDGALFDLPKLNDISKTVISLMTNVELCKETIEFAKKYNLDLLNFINEDKERYLKILNIERGGEKPRKDYIKYSDIYDKIKFFSPSIYDSMFNNIEFNQSISIDAIKNVINLFIEKMDYQVDEQTWFNSILKGVGEQLNFAPNPKLFKQNPNNYVGHIGDLAGIIRMSLTTSTNSPNLYYILQILGKEEVNRRLNKVLQTL